VAAAAIPQAFFRTKIPSRFERGFGGLRVRAHKGHFRGSVLVPSRSCGSIPGWWQGATGSRDWRAVPGSGPSLGPATTGATSLSHPATEARVAEKRTLLPGSEKRPRVGPSRDARRAPSSSLCQRAEGARLRPRRLRGGTPIHGHAGQAGRASGPFAGLRASSTPLCSQLTPMGWEAAQEAHHPDFPPVDPPRLSRT